VIYVKPTFCAAKCRQKGAAYFAIYLCTCVACHRTCVYSRHVRHVCQPPGAGPYLCLSVGCSSCPLRGSRYLCVVMFWSYYLAITGDAPFGQSHLCHPFTCGSPAFPLLPRTPMTKRAMPLCKAYSSASTPRAKHERKWNHPRPHWARDADGYQRGLHTAAPRGEFWGFRGSGGVPRRPHLARGSCTALLRSPVAASNSNVFCVFGAGGSWLAPQARKNPGAPGQVPCFLYPRSDLGRAHAALWQQRLAVCL
jgi:hypothetical protein